MKINRENKNGKTYVDVKVGDIFSFNQEPDFYFLKAVSDIDNNIMLIYLNGYGERPIAYLEKNYFDYYGHDYDSYVTIYDKATLNLEG